MENKARVVAWRTPSMKAAAFNCFHLHCFPKWRKETSLGKYITDVYTSNNPASGTSCAYCRKGLA